MRSGFHSGEMMPRSKAEKTVIHRIELGSWERSRLEAGGDAWVFNRISTPVVAALSDVSFLFFVGGLLASYKLIDKETWEAMTRGGEMTIDAILAALGAAWDAGAKVREEAESAAAFWDYITPGGDTGPIESTGPEFIEWLFGLRRSDLREAVRGGRGG